MIGSNSMSHRELISAAFKYNLEGFSKMFSAVSEIPGKIKEVVGKAFAQKQATAKDSTPIFVPKAPKHDGEGRITQTWKNAINGAAGEALKQIAVQVENQNLFDEIR